MVWGQGLDQVGHSLRAGQVAHGLGEGQVAHSLMGRVGQVSHGLGRLRLLKIAITED